MSDWQSMNVNKKNVSLGASLVLIVVSVLLLFQNCADPLDLASQDALSYNDQLPFAFESTIDTISYMSCSNVTSNYNSRAIFSFRAGAYTTDAGLRLSSNFLAQTGSFSVDQKAQALAQSPRNRNSIAQLAIRGKGQYQSALSSNGNTPVGGVDYSNFLDALDSPAIATAMAALNEGEWVNYFSGIWGLDNRSFETSLYFNSSETIADDVRSKLNDSGLLALTYSPGETYGFAARAPSSDSDAKVYGGGYELSFYLPPGRTNGVHRVLNDVRELNLAEGYPTGIYMAGWECPSNLAFMIVRAEDVGTYACDTTPDRPDTLSATDQDRLEKIRRVLRVEDWYVDLTKNCVVPKDPSTMQCYGPENGQVIRYLSSQTCTGDDKTNLCAHYVSLCTRYPPSASASN